jgi:hypothetical protein
MKSIIPLLAPMKEDAPGARVRGSGTGLSSRYSAIGDRGSCAIDPLYPGRLRHCPGG